jgi:phage-related tail protein
MKYRAVFQDPEDTTRERPVQMLTNNFREVEKWRDEMLAKAQRETAYIEIFETSETLIGFKRKPKAESIMDSGLK